jgi:hypothetical protein
MLKPPYPPGATVTAGVAIDITTNEVSLDIENTDTKAAPVGADLVIIGDSEDDFIPKNMTVDDLSDYVLDQYTPPTLNVTVPEGGTGVATLTEHGVIIGNGGDPVNVTSVGTANQVLTSNGAGLDPEFKDLPAGNSGSMVFLSSVTAASAAQVDLEVTFDTTYDSYVVICPNGSVVNNLDTILLRMKLTGAYATTNYYYALNVFSAGSGPLGSVVLTNGVGNAAGNIFALNINVNKPTGSQLKSVHWTGMNTSFNTPYFVAGAGMNTDTGTLSGIRLYASTGNISGDFYLYGIKKT